MNATQIYWIGQTAPAIADTVRAPGSTANVDLTDATVKFKMRTFNSPTVLVNANATIDTAATGKVHYDPVAADFAAAGEYVAWWSATLANGKLLESLEFTLLVLAHAPSQTVDLCTLADIRQALELEEGISQERDEKIRDYITYASVRIMDEVARELAPRDDGPTTRRFRVYPTRIVRNAVLVSLGIPRSDLRSVVSATINPESTTPTVLVQDVDFSLELSRYGCSPMLRLSRNVQLFSTTNANFGHCNLDIRGAWGFPTVPYEARFGTILTVLSWLRRDMSVFAEADKAEPGQAMPIAPPTYGIPSGAKVQLAPLYRQRVF
jgi:hypothetical protein